MTGTDDQNTIRIPVDYQVPDDATPSYVNNLVIQHTESEFVIHFFYTRLPIILGESDEALLKEKLTRIEAVHPQFVKSIIVSPQKMQDFIDALQGNLDKFTAEQRNDESGA